MRIFNADGSEAEMCGNGARCVARYIGKPKVKIETQAGIIEAKADRDNVKIKLTDPKDLKLDIPVQINQRDIHLNFINTGVPHVVIFVEGLEKIDAAGLGREIRNLQNFAPKGTNVNFVEIVNSDYIKIRTYERGVEDETLACGTGSVAAALIFVLKTGAADKIKVQTKSREVLTVFFRRLRNDFNNVWLEGKVRIVYKGEYNV
jgi:diaminopimelate epimerase